MALIPETREGQLSQLLGGTIADLDITPEAYRAAERRYLSVGEHLKNEGADVYVQGSVLLGTVVAPYGREGEYDLDLVCRWNVAKASITQKDLKDRVGDFLDTYIRSEEFPDGERPYREEGRRSWKLGYEQFHMDVLPSIPDIEALSATRILLTDKNLRNWQHSDPKSYAVWFRQRCEAQLYHVVKKYGAEGTLEAIPGWQERTSLHRIVQVLKRHRDVLFADDYDDKPPSSLITTLAAQAYLGEVDLLSGALAVVQRMPAHIEDRDGDFWVMNPVCEDENFADKWNDYPIRRMKFLHWRDQVERDLEGLALERGGVPSVHERLQKAFGAAPVSRAVARLGKQTRQARESGAVLLTSAGELSSSIGRPIRDHTFFGDPPTS